MTVLLKLKAEWASKTNTLNLWNDGNKANACNGPTSGWPGIFCDEGKVQKIELVGYGLTGTFPKIIAQLENLHVL